VLGSIFVLAVLMFSDLQQWHSYENVRFQCAESKDLVNLLLGSYICFFFGFVPVFGPVFFLTTLGVLGLFKTFVFVCTIAVSISTALGAWDTLKTLSLVNVTPCCTSLLDLAILIAYFPKYRVRRDTN
jgi:hypothetical protein